MPVRATARGAARTPLDADADVLVCGASFAGLSVARALAGSGARVLVLDRYEVGERQTSACAAPTGWLEALGLGGAVRQTFGELVVHTPRVTRRMALPWTFSTFDYRELCALLAGQGDFRFETATVTPPAAAPPREAGFLTAVGTDRGSVRAPLVVDALGWRRVLGREQARPPEALMSRGLEVHPAGTGTDLELWIDPRYARSGYGWSFPARDEVRVGVGSFEPRDHVRRPTERLCADVGRPADGWQGCWIPHALREAVEGDVAFVGDSAGHCLPLTAEGIRTAFFFGTALGHGLRAVVGGRATRAEALARYRAVHEARRWKFRELKRLQDLVLPANRLGVMGGIVAAAAHPRVVRWAFEHYLRVAPPPAAAPASRPLAAAA